jgi:hypothetical protein
VVFVFIGTMYAFIILQEIKELGVLLAVPQVLVRGGLLLYNPDYFV